MLKSLILPLVAFAAFSTIHAQNDAAPAPTDPQIAMIAVTANSVDIDVAKMARKRQATRRSKNSLTQWFAIIRP